MPLAKLRNVVLEYAAIAIYVSAIYTSVVLLPSALALFYLFGATSPSAWLLLAAFLALTFTPLQLTTGALSERFVQFSVARAAAYFPTRVVVTDPEAFRTDRGYLFGFCPHSALPIALPIAFATTSPLLPKELRGRTHGLASSVCFSAPIVRQLYWWLGVRPATRQSISGLLRARKVAVLVPGGVQEVLNMEHGKEVAYLSSRTGFVRLAVQHGAPLVPVWAFGQTRAYSWFRPGPPLVPTWLVERISRAAGAVPIGMFGQYGTPMPHREPLTIVVGRPIPVPELAPGQLEPEPEVLAALLKRFTDDLQALYDKHKAQFGKGEELVIM
ncbi:hypothetical protein CHLRE_03g205050v5 [Chlamydomonas reinhardtii]|uniref:Acyltransferase n=1 Tax=Chlamydomonas reinhardtii TaxID=3055 RepID=A8IXB2_CHLRE|nr:uncharacterized protein CHLRE_03g205050v5 [Chlamydomonas reinhardtii]AGO32159.1 diacylglycerol acyltransferase type 2 [Chlamydomonas reinhardtii]PNW85796.1 hypothetical protein CHLRE_03g205050v5 [Chlamydomonas reinhardtii]|eukprot:XP_001693189.1 diacylglycerol acyl transferase [Chlamydomonas reinhardtii]